MLAKLKARRDSDEGFTLIELMVVVLIIAILVAIAVPTFMGARERAQDRSAQSSARNSLSAARVLWADAGNYESADIVADLSAIEGNITFVTGAANSTDSNTVSVAVLESADVDSLDDTLVFAVYSDSGDCFYLGDNTSDTATAGTVITANSTQYAQDASGDGACNAADAPAGGYVAAW